MYYKYYTCLQSSYFPDLWKTTVVNTLLKKPGLDPIFKNWLPTEDAYENGALSHHMKIKEGANPLFMDWDHQKPTAWQNYDENYIHDIINSD